MLNTVVLSDLHFGEPYNLVHDQGVPPILNLIKAHAFVPSGPSGAGEARLRRLVLAGDIFEMSTPESMDLLRKQSRFFMQQARSRFRIDEVIWVPGNHDYSLFRKHLPGALTTSPHGEPAPRPFIDDLFGADWQIPVRIAYPHLLLSEKKGGRPTGRSWLIHHGHLLDDLILGRTRHDRTRAFFSALGGGRIVSPVEVPRDQPLLVPDIEKAVRPLVEAIWQHHPNPNNLQNEVWDLVRRFETYFSCKWRKPELAIGADGEPGILKKGDLANAWAYVQAVRRDPGYPKAPAGSEHVTLIYGHSHGGGTHVQVFDRVMLHVVNLGGWIAVEGPTRAGHEPHTHIYMINDDLKERMYTAPFPAGWAQRCLDHGKLVFAIPGPDDEFIERVMNAPPAAGISVEEILGWHRQHPFGDTKERSDPLAP